MVGLRWRRLLLRGGGFHRWWSLSNIHGMVEFCWSSADGILLLWGSELGLKRSGWGGKCRGLLPLRAVKLLHNEGESKRAAAAAECCARKKQ